jgi:hypothetical protein
MANVSRSMGFRPAKSLMGAPWWSLVRYYPAGNRSADTTNNHGDIYRGDPVKLSSGAVLPANSGDTILGVAVAVGTTTSTFGATGYYDPNNLGKMYLGFADTGVVGVVPAELALFEAEEATDLDLVQGSAADINSAAATAHGSRTTGWSSVKLVADSNHDVQVVEMVTSPDNDPTITAAKFLVKFTKTQNALN